ncbi:methyl-accepting chemotaxis protein [Paenibacillus sp. GCM10027627]|uniref:methyl-accepting chemotaxis protein n=1 Tax=unclassified Paenibacillus TaxID=185978 RepID=UPI003632C601
MKKKPLEKTNRFAKPLFRITISRKLLAGFIAVLLILASTLSVSYSQISKVDKEYTRLLDDTGYQLILVQQLNVQVKKEQAGLSGYLLQGSEAQLQDFTDAHNEYKRLSRALEEVIVQPEALAMLQALIKLENEYYHVANNAISLTIQNKRKESLEMLVTKGSAIIEQFDQKADEMVLLQQNKLEEGKKMSHEEAEATKRFVLFMGAAAVVISMFVSWFVGRIISRPIVKIAEAAGNIAAGDLSGNSLSVRNRDEVGDLAESFNQMSMQLRELIRHVGSSAEQVAASAQQLTATSEQAAYASEQIAETMQQVAMDADNGFQHITQASHTVQDISSGASLMADRAQQVSNTATDAYEKAVEGGQAIQTAIDQMSSIHDTVDGLSAQINGLGERSAQIKTIVSAISDIAKQTNILSLNAGIEAARAGDHGRGFLVVASEIRKLAEQSSSSAGQIGELVAAIREETELAVRTMGTATREVASGIEAVHSAGTAFVQIQTFAGAVNEQIQDVSASSTGMASGAEGMVHGMKAVTGASQSTVTGAQTVSASTEEQLASMEEIAASAKSLSHLAEELQTQIEKFKV